ncbi:MAG: chemotaxis protein CheW [Vicinamibacteria bacterium]
MPSTRERIQALQSELSGLRKRLLEDGADRTASLPATVSLLLITCGEMGIAIDALSLVEVLPRVALESQAEPLSGSIGVMRYRGTLVPVIDLFERLGSPSALPLLAQRIIVVNGDDGLRGLLVDETLDVVTMRRIDLISLVLDSTIGQFGLASAQVGERAFTVLNLKALLTEVPDVR